jgi:hypothetical protein
MDILSIDTEIKDKFQKELKDLPTHRKRLKRIDETLKMNNLSYRVKNDLRQEYSGLQEIIEDTESRKSYNFYIMETAPIIKKYREILEKPVVHNFMGKSRADYSERRETVRNYLRIAQKYFGKSLKVNQKKKKKSECQICKNQKNFDIIDGEISICVECGVQQDIFSYCSSYKDIDRVNISTKYTYDRSVHFRDCINQYQGKQNSTINEQVYKDLENQFEAHQLLVGKKGDPKEIRFANIEREHIHLFLKETDHTKHYEDVILIHYNMTGKKPDDISHLEDVLLNDFEVLAALYDEKFIKPKIIDRKNFINTQYVLYQLLKRHKYPCKKEDFNILKTMDRKSFHDDICRVLFTSLGWNFHPVF